MNQPEMSAGSALANGTAAFGLVATPTASARVHIETKPGVARRAVLTRITAIIPCFNRHQDVELLLNDLAKVKQEGVELMVVCVDNASTEPISRIPSPRGLNVVHHRMSQNLGGAGGFGAGMAYAVSHPCGDSPLPPDFVWLLDSDVRVTPGALLPLVRALEKHPTLGAVGSALRDPITGVTYEIGGWINRKTGAYQPAAQGDVDRRFLVKSRYLAACSTLVRREVIEKTGLMPEVFINGDDVEWSLRMQQATGLKLAACPRSVVYHPWRKFQTWQRYYIARNSFQPLDTMNLGGWVRFRRAMLEVHRAVAQTIMGMEELAIVHLNGLEDAANGKIFGQADPSRLKRPTLLPLTELGKSVREEASKFGPHPRLYLHPVLTLPLAGTRALRDQIAELGIKVPKKDRKAWVHCWFSDHIYRDVAGAAWRLVTGMPADVAVVPTGWPTSWFRGRVLVEISTDGFSVIRVHRARHVRKALGVWVTGLKFALRLARRTPVNVALPPAPTLGTHP